MVVEVHMDEHRTTRVELWGLAVSAVLSLAFAACQPGDDSPEDASSGTSASSGAATDEPFPIAQCSTLLTQSECEGANAGESTPDACRWIDVRTPGPACDGEVVVSQCVGMAYVGDGCQVLTCDDGSGVDGFVREVDGVIEVFANPPADCGLVAMHDGWTSCGGSDIAECSCLCAP